MPPTLLWPWRRRRKAPACDPHSPRFPPMLSIVLRKVRSVVVARPAISSGGPFEPIYGYSRAVRVGAHVHVAGTAARGEALAGKAHMQTLETRSALIRPARTSKMSYERPFSSLEIKDANLLCGAHREVFGDTKRIASGISIRIRARRPIASSSSPCRGALGRGPGSRTPWPVSSTNGGRRGQSDDWPNRLVCAADHSFRHACAGDEFR